MARTAGSWGALAALALIAVVQPLGCDPEAGPNPASEFVQQVLDEAPQQVILPVLEEVRGSLEQLRSSVQQWTETGDPSAKLGAFESWRETMSIWQRAELLQVGPAAPSLATGGRDLRDAIYSWPTINPCRVDQETVLGEWDEPDFAATRLVNATGLDALEHLLLASPDNACPNQVDINAAGSWDALSPSAVDARRAQYAGVLVDLLIDTTDTLIDAWQSEFSLDAATYGSEQEALNALFDALFYLETTTKDRKLAEPMGLGDCLSDCGSLVESGASGTSTRWIVDNLRGFRHLFTGGDGIGMHGLLGELGHADLATSMLDDTDAAIAAFEGLDPWNQPIDALIVSDPQRLQQAFDALKRVTDALKGDLATVLSLELPTEAAGDND